MHNNYLIVEAKTADALRAVQLARSRKQKEDNQIPLLFHLKRQLKQLNSLQKYIIFVFLGHKFGTNQIISYRQSTIGGVVLPDEYTLLCHTDQFNSSTFEITECRVA